MNSTAQAESQWVIVQNPEIDKGTCAIRDGTGRHVAYMVVDDAVRVVSAVNGKPASIHHPDEFRDGK